MIEHVYWLNSSYWPILNLHAIFVRNSPALDINSVELEGARLSMVINASELLQSASDFVAFLINRAARPVARRRIAQFVPSCRAHFTTLVKRATLAT